MVLFLYSKVNHYRDSLWGKVWNKGNQHLKEYESNTENYPSYKGLGTAFVHLLNTHPPPGSHFLCLPFTYAKFCFGSWSSLENHLETSYIFNI